jgi:hypothetical protein
VSHGQLRDWISQGRVTGTTLVCRGGSLDWQVVAALPEFRPFVAPGRAPAAAPAAVDSGQRRTSSWAIWGFVCGLLSLTLCSCCCLPLDLLGIIFSTIALVQISNNPETRTGRTLAILGLVLSALSLLLGFAFSALWFGTGAAEEFMRELEREFSTGAGRSLHAAIGTLIAG